MASHDERKQELERKKQRLAEIREEKRRREEERRQKLLQHQQNKEGADGSVSLPTDDEMEKILEDVGISAQARAASPEKGLAVDRGMSPGMGSPARTFRARTGSATLQKSETTQVNIAPKDFVAYNKTTQTDTGGEKEFIGTVSGEWWEEDELDGGGVGVGGLGETPEEVPAKIEEKERRSTAPLIPDYSEEEKQQILTSPEFQVFFNRTSRILERALTEEFHPNLLLGGTYSGQVCLWDNRQNKKTPVQRSPLSTSAHTHPVYSMEVVGTQNAHNLISVSTDGRMCSWSLDMLAQPQETLDLQWKQSRQVASTSLSFPLHDVNNFVVGSEEGVVYSGCRHGTKAGILEAFEGHFAPVTGIDCHRAVGNMDFTHLFLTSSFDWTVKLWNVKEQKALHSFEDHNDYVLDVAWSPIHPALFVCVDGQGRVDLWNLNQDMELPQASVFVEGRPALNKVMWTPNGQQLVVGDNQGSIWMYDVSESLANPRPDEWEELSKTLMDLKQAQMEAEELSQAMGVGQTR